MNGRQPTGISSENDHQVELVVVASGMVKLRPERTDTTADGDLRSFATADRNAPMTYPEEAGSCVQRQDFDILRLASIWV